MLPRQRLVIVWLVLLVQLGHTSHTWSAGSGRAGEQKAWRLLQVRKIWDRAPHNAFTDLVHHQGRWWCVFREGQGHVSPDGALRVITSLDGSTWESAAVLRSEHADLRDAKLTITPDGRFMLSGAAALHSPQTHTHQSYVWFSRDGRIWGDAIPVADPNYWLWRITWHRDVCYGIGYECGKVKNLRLYRSRDGQHFQTLVKDLYNRAYPNETSILFQPDESAICLLRRDPGHGLLGTAKAPYTEWTWKDVGLRIGGPHMIALPGRGLVAAVRLYDTPVRTALCQVDPQSGRLYEMLALPSSGDTSYPGLVWRDGLLWISYYSSHEGKTSIYLAQVEIPKSSNAIGQE
jgi:hypothetical protein